jgi:hypothetical protein
MPLDYRARDYIPGYLQYCMYPGKIYCITIGDKKSVAGQKKLLLRENCYNFFSIKDRDEF